MSLVRAEMAVHAVANLAGTAQQSRALGEALFALHKFFTSISGCDIRSEQRLSARCHHPASETLEAIGISLAAGQTAIRAFHRAGDTVAALYGATTRRPGTPPPRAAMSATACSRSASGSLPSGPIPRISTAAWRPLELADSD